MRLKATDRVVSTQLVLVEGVHFDSMLCSPRELGHRCLAIALSDLAVAGAVPQHVQITVGVLQETTEPFLMELDSGWRALAKKFKMSVGLSPTVLSPTAFSIYLTVVGSAPARSDFARQPKAGDLIAVTGGIGGSAAALRCLKVFGRHELRTETKLLQPHLLPEPRVREAQALLKSKAVTSWIELSDGLASELHSLCEQTKLGAEIDETLFPILETTRRAASLLGTPDAIQNWTLYGAEDFELLVTLSPSSLKKAQQAMKATGVPLTVIGKLCERGEKIRFKNSEGAVSELQGKLWHPFVRRRKVG